MATRPGARPLHEKARTGATWPIEIWQQVRMVSRHKKWITHRIVIEASEGDRERWEAEFWQHLPESGRRLHDAVMSEGGICVLLHGGYVRGQGLRPSYGPISCGKAKRLCEQWRRDPARFESERPPAIVKAVRRFAEDDEKDAELAGTHWADVVSRLPTPPAGYAWFQLSGCFSIADDVWFQLYPEKSFGPPRG
jgi:hypothetical protein